ncbi:hypothetical protein [Mycoplasmopsis felifaucium]|uniref:hypothetical protein n=1 Tax=Mycoplasmopsis felifaucium TaxID=35768 RepID=UPI0004889280|nr:hypothetical protein [Mycoplasmopsis felifaucium]
MSKLITLLYVGLKWEQDLFYEMLKKKTDKCLQCNTVLGAFEQYFLKFVQANNEELPECNTDVTCKWFLCEKCFNSEFWNKHLENSLKRLKQKQESYIAQIMNKNQKKDD